MAGPWAKKWKRQKTKLEHRLPWRIHLFSSHYLVVHLLDWSLSPEASFRLCLGMEELCMNGSNEKGLTRESKRMKFDF